MFEFQLVFATSVGSAATIVVGAVTALGTVALAITGFVAYRSNRNLVEAAKAQAAAIEQQSQQVARQATAVEQQAQAASEQADVARLALARQQEPHLVPTGSESCRVGELIDIPLGPGQVLRIRKVFLDVENAGFGVAIITGAEARSRDRGEYNVWPPPAIPPGGTRALVLAPDASVPAEAPAGDPITVLVRYAGVTCEERSLRFTATYYPDGNWHVQSLDAG